MASSVHLLLLLTFSLLVLFFNPTCVYGNGELRALLDLKTSLDPEGQFLSSWTMDSTPCGGSFEGVACNEKGQVANVSLQGKGLSGKLSPAIAGLKHLTGLYLHYNSLYGEIPREVANLTQLSDLYLNVNHLSGEIPPEIGKMENLQVLQLCYNKLTGSIPTQLGDLKKLSVLALQSNHLAGAIPASLGDLGMLTRLDLSSNSLFGSIPTKLADLPSLQVLDVHNNTLSGNVPPDLIATNCGDKATPSPIGVSRKLKENGRSTIKSSSKNKDDIDQPLDDYDPVEAVPSPSKDSLNPVPLEHGTPLNPYIIPKPSPPKPGDFN